MKTQAVRDLLVKSERSVQSEEKPEYSCIKSRKKRNLLVEEPPRERGKGT